MKKVWPAVLYLLILCSCGKEIDRAEAMQEQYKNLASYETDVRVSVPRGDETLVYALHLSAQGDAVRATVSEPEELTGVGAVLEGDKLTLTFDDLVLDVGTLSPRVTDAQRRNVRLLALAWCLRRAGVRRDRGK